jgi:hypothetical protein
MHTYERRKCNMAKTGLGPLGNPKGLLEIRGRRPASGESLVDLGETDPIEHVAGDAMFRGNRYTAAMNRAKTDSGFVGDSTKNIWTSESDVVQAGELPLTEGPSSGAPTAANPLGEPFSESLEQ